MSQRAAVVRWCPSTAPLSLAGQVVFSGYGKEWWDDMHLLDVSSMVGPPYLLKDVFPRKGPVTGGTPIDLIGMDFPNTSEVVVRFEWDATKEFIDVPGAPPPPPRRGQSRARKHAFFFFLSIFVVLW